MCKFDITFIVKELIYRIIVGYHTLENVKALFQCKPFSKMSNEDFNFVIIITFVESITVAVPQFGLTCWILRVYGFGSQMHIFLLILILSIVNVLLSFGAVS